MESNITTKIISLIGWLLLFAALGFYLYGIGLAVYLSWPASEPIIPPAIVTPILYPEILSTTIGSIQALLLTNLGVVLGIAITNPNSNSARFLKLTLPSRNDSEKVVPSPIEINEIIQLLAVAVFIVVLVACLVVWIHKDFSVKPEYVVSVIPESGKIFLGVVLAYLAAVLSH